ncbi:RNA recognition motif (RRM) superfamily protein [Metarhizium robertsii]|uniref:RNA recognition motif domain protein n=2 Tax=Metarhizium robertsii TaxID=568076 RepID=E9FCT9_METRA|nr:RNA recognition motif domain protein [Metarhizium robertsii ARSEF 23]EFY94466.1 RNA recognition motif domain protein [Metarhizium robertsii ARSEF 23]EXU99272.1 RNA recognition motif (RRM) superfamily protein [Metarhizium robertsii]
MPPQIKQDLNRSGWESTDFPSVCENCLPENPYVKMLKEDYGAECKLCTRPFTVFSWNGADRAQNRRKKTNICLTCARLKNCCQSCMLDLSFGLPIAVRDAALKMVAPGPQSDINREYFAQNNEKLIEDGKAGIEEYEKTDEKARELLRRLANSKPYFRKGRAVDESELVGSSSGGSVATGAGQGGPGPVRTRDSRAAAAAGARPRGGKGRQAFPSAAQLPPSEKDWLPPDDTNIMSLFITGVEDDLPEFKLREYFKVHGKIKSLVCSHMSHCAFINYETRAAAEKAAAACQGRAVIAGCPLRVRWGQPKAIGTMNKEERGQMLRDARVGIPRKPQHRGGIEAGSHGASQALLPPSSSVAAPPGADDTPNYASLSGD